MKKRLFALIIFAALTSSCSIYHVNSAGTTSTFYPSRLISEVTYQENIDRPHKIIGTITVNAERRQDSTNEIIEKMKREAAILGGDAITNIQSDATGVWKRLPVQQVIGNAYVRANFTASVAVFE